MVWSLQPEFWTPKSVWKQTSWSYMNSTSHPRLPPITSKSPIFVRLYFTSVFVFTFFGGLKCFFFSPRFDCRTLGTEAFRSFVPLRQSRPPATSRRRAQRVGHEMHLEEPRKMSQYRFWEAQKIRRIIFQSPFFFVKTKDCPKWHGTSSQTSPNGLTCRFFNFDRGTKAMCRGWKANESAPSVRQVGAARCRGLPIFWGYFILGCGNQVTRNQPRNIRTILGFPLQLSCFFLPAMARGHRLKPGLMLRVAARRYWWF